MEADKNLQFMQKGGTGCVFATIFSRNPEKVGWFRVFNPEKLEIPKDAYLVSFIFEGKNKEYVREWALDNGMYEEPTSEITTGLRFKASEGVSWVQYFGKDSHVKTRQTPNSELLFCVKLPVKSYFKVGFKGILHLAHASVEHLKKSTLDLFWNKSFVNVENKLNHKPSVLEAAKTTFLHEK